MLLASILDQLGDGSSLVIGAFSFAALFGVLKGLERV